MVLGDNNIYYCVYNEETKNYDILSVAIDAFNDLPKLIKENINYSNL